MAHTGRHRLDVLLAVRPTRVAATPCPGGCRAWLHGTIPAVINWCFECKVWSAQVWATEPKSARPCHLMVAARVALFAAPRQRGHQPCARLQLVAHQPRRQQREEEPCMRGVLVDGKFW
jgi:hypothetical protein